MMSNGHKNMILMGSFTPSIGYKLLYELEIVTAIYIPISIIHILIKLCPDWGKNYAFRDVTSQHPPQHPTNQLWMLRVTVDQTDIPLY
ncbi:hypothetical protein XENTR_v10013321 [Xenopus tropicalis]|nr:hypothetical protein XENTR_v10013321 [Xenopus tropicalis]